MQFMSMRGGEGRVEGMLDRSAEIGLSLEPLHAADIPGFSL